MVKTPAVLVCCLCEQVIEGKYDYSKTKRGNTIYCHKDKKCPDKLEKIKERQAKYENDRDRI